MIQAAYERRPGWRWRIRLVATVFAAVCSALADAGEVSLGALLDWRHAGGLIDKLLGEDRQLDEAQRTAALDIGGVLTARTARSYSALAAITIGARWPTDAANRLGEAVGVLPEAVGGKQRRYQQARTAAQRVLSDFRRAADLGAMTSRQAHG